MSNQNKTVTNEVDHHTRIFGINIQKIIPFIAWRWFSLIGSALVILTGVVMYIANGGFKMGIDFQGGIRVEAQISQANADISSVRKLFKDLNLEADINNVGEPTENHYMITLPVLKESTSDEVNMITEQLQKNYGQDKVTIKGSEMVDAKIGKDFTNRAINLVLIAAGLILVYVIFRFNLYFGAGAVGALLHDVLMMLSFAMFFKIPIDITVIAAILTILGYSINDTIVVFDRIREMRSLNQDEDFEYVIDKSITQTLSRTIITSLTVFFVVMAIFFWGGIVLHNFAFMLMVGVIDGTYSSIFIAAPITYMMRKSLDKKVKKNKSAVQAAAK